MGGTITPQLWGELTTGGYVPTTTSGSVYEPWGTGYVTPSVYYYHTVTPPVECSGDVHVFPCPHCEKCKCGKATVKRERKK